MEGYWKPMFQWIQWIYILCFSPFTYMLQEWLQLALTESTYWFADLWGEGCYCWNSLEAYLVLWEVSEVLILKQVKNNIKLDG